MILARKILVTNNLEAKLPSYRSMNKKNTPLTKIKDAVFVKGIIGTDPILSDTKRKIAFVGRSNVGKSSVINMLVDRKALAYPSTRPGKTFEINFFLINNERYFIDLPGYGYARRTEKEREKIRKHIIWFFTQSGASLNRVVLIVDAIARCTDNDKEMLTMLLENGHDVVVAVNKCDKLKSAERSKMLDTVKKDVNGIARKNLPIVSVSARTREGKDALLTILMSKR